MFGRKKKTDNKKEENEYSNKEKVKEVKKNYPYKVYLKDVYGSSTKKLKPFGVERWIDEKTATVYLRNTENGFKERLPEDSDEFKMYELTEVSRNIIKLEKQLAKETRKDGAENIKDIQYSLIISKKHKRSLELQGRGSYMNLDDDGVPYFVFRRKGMFKLPEFDNVELDTIYTPSETKIKKASELMDMKKEKYSKFNKNITTINMVLFFCLIFFGGLLVWWSLKLNAVSNESAVIQLQERIDDSAMFCAEMYGRAGENFLEASKYAVNITKGLVESKKTPPINLGNVIPE